jgi:hypothetical protein
VKAKVTVAMLELYASGAVRHGAQRLLAARRYLDSMILFFNGDGWSKNTMMAY